MYRSIEVAVVCFFVGVLFVVVANTIGIFNFTLCWSADHTLLSCDAAQVSVRKELGFFLALNWSWSLVFFVPLFAYFGLKSMELGRTAIEDAVRRGMIRNKDWSRVSPELVHAVAWRRLRLSWLVAAAVVVIAVIFIGGDFYQTITVFYNDPQRFAPLRFPDPAWAVDWTMAGALCRYLGSADCGPILFGRSINELFAGAAYVYLPGLGAVASITFMTGFGLFATLFGSKEFTRDAGLILVPDPDSDDPRGGFEIFELLFQHAIIACLCLFAMGYLVALQNVYFQTADTNILDLVFPVDFSKFVANVPNLPRYINPRVAAVSMIGLLFLVIVIVAAVSALNSAAVNGRNRLLEAIDPESPEHVDVVAKMDIADFNAARDRLFKIKPWPLHWPTVTTLIIWLVAASISMLVVSAGLWVIAGAILFAFGELGFKKVQDAAAPPATPGAGG